MEPVPFSRPWFSGREADEVAAVLDSRWVTQGPKVAEFERRFAERVGAAEAVAVANCTCGLHLVLHALGIGPGDEVIVPSLSFIATANAVRHCGAEPVFADVDRATYNLDPAAAEAAVTPRTKAVMPVHQIGLAADMDAFAEIAERRGLLLIEDAAPAIGATYRGRAVGSLGPVAVFSLHARKVLTTGEGGMITTSDRALADRLRKLRHHGMSVSDLERHRSSDIVFESYLEVGFNYRMSDIHAAVGVCQLEDLDRILATRRALAERYNEALNGIAGIEAPVEPADREHSWQSYAVRVDAREAGIERDDLMRALLADGIATRRGVSAAHREPPYAGSAAVLPETDAAHEQTMLLPLFPDLTREQQDRVCASVAAHAGKVAA